uniref:Ig-like domain-containing protein n=1 Tax=Mastacembelus armatus TaxID=205130 RepID=A0A3Q3SC88_9TELE
MHLTVLRVIGGNVTVVQGGTVILPCKLTDTTEDLNQISWQRDTRRKPQTDNFYTIQKDDAPHFVNGEDNRFKFIGSIKDKNGSLQLSNVTLLDEGIYRCIFTLFPSGNHKTEMHLNVLGMMTYTLSRTTQTQVGSLERAFYFLYILAVNVITPSRRESCIHK